MSSSQRRQIMQPWPLCVMPFSKSKERAILPNYKRVPLIPSRSSTASSNLGLDCASNTTLLTNVSPFNSQITLLVDQKKSTSNENQKPNHYYAENLRNNHQNALNRSQIYDPLGKELGPDYKQIDPLLKSQQRPVTKKIMDLENPKDKVSFQFGKDHKISVSTKYASQEQHWRVSIFIRKIHRLLAKNTKIRFKKS
ncbi:uncharacterized protein LOC117167835 [Belonocnema kinseyi]|uniref:uncharacterized protein LOC117167835 n=1 Tax=Belonocnema kinseyi TaxID=2817044 RepID=UPI00143E0A74|nr:uncharacterized protein LOC117167835 [Belonocnema kinseyi]